MRSFVKIKSSQNGKNTLSFTDVYKSWQSLEFFKWQMSFNTRSIRKKLFSQKMSEFTVHRHQPYNILRLFKMG